MAKREEEERVIGACPLILSDGGSPIGLLEALYGPLSQSEIDTLVEEAKQAYNWQGIVDKVRAIPPQYIDSKP
jgi:hypothetical protein